MLVGLVILHELGHFYAARKSGVEVEEFGIGFPPKAKSLGKKNGTEYTLNWLPLGGFVRLKGEHDSDTEQGTYGAASLKNKVKIMVAGVLVNLLTAVLLMSVVAAVGLPRVLDNQFSVASDTKIVRHDVVLAYVVPESPAANAGLEQQDKLLSIAPTSCEGQGDCEQAVTSRDSLQGITPLLAGVEVSVRYEDDSDKQMKSQTLTLLNDEQIRSSEVVFEECKNAGTDVQDCPSVQSYLGVIPDDYIEQSATWSAPIVGVVFSGQVIQETLANFGQIIGGLFQGDTEPAQEQVTGVLGIGYILGELADRGFMSVLFLTAVISLSLALMNILPIPALDGGRLFVTLLFRLFRKPLSKDLEEKIHGSGFMLLMLLFVAVTVLDVQRFILS